MTERLERPLKELLAAVYHDHQKHASSEIREDQEKVLNELLQQPIDYKNYVQLRTDGLEINTLREHVQYIHANNLEERILVIKGRQTKL